jgi:class 3 adenylate cyclase/tetratricopeptide (TPR) repeat protein
VAAGTTKTFLFTDIVASTRLWESMPDLMPAMMDRHDQLTEDVLSHHEGWIADHTGDGVFAVLPEPAAGVAAAVDLQLELAAESWPHGERLLVRCGVHSGEVVARGERLSGTEIHRAARIMQAAEGAQILVSEATRTGVGRRLGDRIGFRPFGTVSLRGLRHAERIFEVTHPNLARPAPGTSQRRQGPGAATTIVVERDDELEHLETRWATAEDGSGSVVVIAGEAGIGKSTLIRAFLDHLDPDRVLRGVCDDLATRRTFGAIRDLALDASGPLRSVAFDDRDAVFSALLEEIRLQPTVVVIEDLHWADDATLDAVQLLSHRADALPLLLVMSTRPTRPDERSVFEAIGGASSSTTLALRPLTPEGVAVIAAGSSMSAAALHHLTGGNPFFLTELLAADSDVLPTSVREAVLVRLRNLPDETRRALDQIAVVPGEVARWLVDPLLDDVAVLDPAERSGVIVSTPESIRFRHELARQAVYDALLSHHRIRLHASVAAALEAAEADHAMIVHHALEARDPAMVMRHAQNAIRDAIYSGSATEALGLIEILETNRPRDDTSLQGWAELQRALALSALDRGDAALDAARKAVALLQPNGPSLVLAEAHRTLARIAWWLRDFAMSASAANEALQVLDSVEPDEAAAIVRSQLAHLMALSRDPEASDAATRALQVAVAVESERAEASAHIAAGLSAASAAERTEHLLAAIEKARAVGDVETEARATTNLASALTHSHRYAEAAKWLPVAEDIGRRSEQLAALGIAVGLQAWLRALRGDLERALPAFDEFIDEMENPNQKAWGLLHKGLVLARLGRLDEGFALVESARGHRAGRSTSPELVFEAANVEVRWLAGEPVEAEPIFDEVLWPNRREEPADYVGRLARNLARTGYPIPRFDLDLKGYAEALWGDPVAAACIWEEIGNPYERGVELALAGAVEGRAVLESIGARGAIRRIYGG